MGPNIVVETQFGRKHPEIQGKMAVYDIGVCPNSIPQCESLNPPKNETIVFRLTG